MPRSFNEAAQAAVAACPKGQWNQLAPAERTWLIYLQIKLMDKAGFHNASSFSSKPEAGF